MSTLNATACAALLNCSKSKLFALARSGEIPACKIGRGYVFVEADIIEWLRVKSQPKPVPVVRPIGRPRKRVVTTSL